MAARATCLAPSASADLQFIRPSARCQPRSRPRSQRLSGETQHARRVETSGTLDQEFLVRTPLLRRLPAKLTVSQTLSHSSSGQALLLFYLVSFVPAPSLGATAETPAPTTAPYPPSSFITDIAWHWETLKTAAPGSDLWPVTWGADDHLYTAWGDGGGFGGSDSDGRVSMGFARIEGGPENCRGINVNGGKNPESPASFPKKGKTSGIAFVDGTLYASINLQDGPWPAVNHTLAWS